MKIFPNHSNLYTALEMSKIVAHCKDQSELYRAEECYVYLLRNNQVSPNEGRRFYTLVCLRAEQLDQQTKK